MIDHLLGRPSAVWKRTQVVLVILFWYWRLRSGHPRGPLLFRRLSKSFAHLTPWQWVVTLLTLLYGLRHWDTLLGLGAPEPLARLYSRGFYRATWINTALDAGFATAAPIKFKWLRDAMSLAFSAYYLVYASEADEKLRKYRAIPTVEMMRVTWEKTTNPYIRFFTSHDRPKMAVRKRLFLPRPPGSRYTKPVSCWLYYSKPELELARCKDLIFDIPGGGFIAMSPVHHEDRILRWAIKTGKPVLSLDYCKAPEYPFPYALDECVDVYRLVHETKGRVLGMGRDVVDIVLTGDSAGANLAAGLIITLIEAPHGSPLNVLPHPVSVIWIYPALDFNLTAWMPASSLRLLRRDQSASSLPEGLLESKKHLDHHSPLAVVDDRAVVSKSRESTFGRDGLRQSFGKLPSIIARAVTPMLEKPQGDMPVPFTSSPAGYSSEDEQRKGIGASQHAIKPLVRRRSVRERSIGERVLYHDNRRRRNKVNGTREAETDSDEAGGEVGKPLQTPVARSSKKNKVKAFGTRLTMSSRAGYFNDRIITPSMMRCMAICYIGPNSAPDLTKDYYISPIFAPQAVFAKFPPLNLFCGEKDPFVDDTVLIAGKVKAAKRAFKAEAQRVFGGGHGEFLRMSMPQATEETEDDWVQMRIFEGWSHGFAQMASILPEVQPALDLMATFISSAFSKHDSKTRSSRKQTLPPARADSPRPQLAIPSIPLPNEVNETKLSVDLDEVLSFTPRRRAARSSDSGRFSPAPGGGTSATSRHSTPPEVKITLGFSSSDEALPNGPCSPLFSPSRFPKSPIGANETPSVCCTMKNHPTSPRSSTVSSTSPTTTNTSKEKDLSSAMTHRKKEGQIMDDHDDLLVRRRADAGYGIPIVQSPDSLFHDPEHHLDHDEDHTGENINEEESLLKAGSKGQLQPTHEAVRKSSDDAFKGHFVGEEDLYERRRMDAAYGIPSK